VTTVTAVNSFSECGGVCKTSSRSSRVTGSGGESKGAYLRGDCASQSNPYPLISPTENLSAVERPAFPPCTTASDKFSGCRVPFQRAALLGRNRSCPGASPTPPKGAMPLMAVSVQSAFALLSQKVSKARRCATEKGGGLI
jgi:hypothetical protein